MTKIATDDLNGQSCEATGHPTNCTEPVPGTIQGSGHSVTVNNANGEEKPIATRASTLHFDTHSHDYSSELGCHANQSHDLTGTDFNDANLSSSLNINGEPVIVLADDVSTDPGSNGPVNMTGTGISDSLNETQP